MPRSQWKRADALIETLGISRATLSRWLERGLPHHKIGRLLLFDEDEVDRWIKAQGPTPKTTRRRGKGGRQA